MVQENCLNKVIVICGPTASGKTTLAVECAKLLNSEVISADSMYIYKNMNVGTAKPNLVEMQGIPHHLIDVIEPNESFSVSDYKKLADPIVKDLISNGKIPIICGGTGFYINSLLYDLSYGNGDCDPSVREKYKLLAQEKGAAYVYEILKNLDPDSAENLHFNDTKRVIRALEIYESGIKKSDIKDSFTPKYDYRAYSIDFPRDVLYERINARVDNMINNGLLEEINSLISSGISNSHQCMQAIGYKEILDYLDGNCTLDQAIDSIKLNTRHYAKRQITFFKKLNVVKLKPDSVENLAKTIIKDVIND